MRTEVDQYDIIYINWDQGRDDLRRNAFLLQDIIEWVNSVKTDPSVLNVVLGQSMGGVIARYTLATMEQDNDPTTNHDASLYISHDAPHQGANTPLGVQFFARHMINEYVSTPLGDLDLPAANGTVSIGELEDAFNSMASRQLLSNTINNNFTIDNTVFDEWQIELRNLGYPQLTRNIAISNGSHCAGQHPKERDIDGNVTTLLDPQDELLHLSGDFAPTVLTDIIVDQLG